ncbi:MAG: NAD(P)/FAD-dependent oxidoreductase [Brevinematales bacterium]|nr:NAD(P)/FAD-dependent oxidoreductase [Brevinematales bacterium]
MGFSSYSDILIVGGGIAGLTAAAFLSKAGLKIELCEKEKTTGGLVNSFNHNGFVFDGGIRSIENSGIVFPMLKQLGIEIEFLPSEVSIGIGKDVIKVLSKDSLEDYHQLLNKTFPGNIKDVSAIIQEIRKIMGYMDILYGIENPLFMDLKNNPKYVFKTILPWVLKYMLVMPKISKLNNPVDEYLTKFSDNQELIDIIAQHFFQKTPTFFALSYFSLYLDYRYPKGGTGTLTSELEKFITRNGGIIRKEVEIVEINPQINEAADIHGNIYGYKKLLWAADQKNLYNIVDLESFTNQKAARKIQARQELLKDKIGCDSVFTLYLTVNLDKSYFSDIASAHLFYTPYKIGLSKIPLKQIMNSDLNGQASFINNKPQIKEWLQKYLELTTYEISIPVLRDNSLAPAGKTGLIVSTLFDYSLMEHIQKNGWYDELKKFMADCMVDVLNSTIFPELKKSVIDNFTSSPLTLKRISGNSDGAITGWSFTNETIPAVNKMIKVSKSVFTPIPDTYQAGQWTYSPSGLPISILTGKLAADKILKDLK